MFNPTAFFILKSLEGTACHFLRNHAILALLCSTEDVRCEVVRTISHYLLLNGLEKASLSLRFYVVLNWIYFMVNERSDELCTIPQSLLGRRIGRSECPSLSPCQLNIDLVYRRGQKLASTLSPLSVQRGGMDQAYIYSRIHPIKF